jgi:hypothetical protein
MDRTSIELDQSRYCTAIVKKYLDVAGAPKVDRAHSTPLPLDFILTSNDCSTDEAAAKALEREYNIDFASCVGSLIYLGMTRCDVVHTVNKLAKFTRQPGRNHFEALLHVLWYWELDFIVTFPEHPDFTATKSGDQAKTPVLRIFGFILER